MDLKKMLKVAGVYSGLVVVLMLLVEFLASHFLGKYDYCFLKMIVSMLVGTWAVKPSATWILGKLL